jgi:hypothetical protein
MLVVGDHTYVEGGIGLLNANDQFCNVPVLLAISSPIFNVHVPFPIVQAIKVAQAAAPPSGM